MRRVLPLLLLLTLVTALPASADPGVKVAYEADLLRVTLEGSYTGATYEVYRAADRSGPFAALSAQATLCTGDCFLTDGAVTPGATYFYRFDLRSATGNTVSFGPYEIVVPQSPLALDVSPNPSGAAARIALTLPGSSRRDGALQADVRVLDLQGRTVRRLHDGLLPRGTTSFAWDGRNTAGASVGAGLYFVRVDTPLGSATTRVVRFR